MVPLNRLINQILQCRNYLDKQYLSNNIHNKMVQYQYFSSKNRRLSRIKKIPLLLPSTLFHKRTIFKQIKNYNINSNTSANKNPTKMTYRRNNKTKVKSNQLNPTYHLNNLICYHLRKKEKSLITNSNNLTENSLVFLLSLRIESK